MPRRMFTWCWLHVAIADPQMPRPLLARSCPELLEGLGPAPNSRGRERSWRARSCLMPRVGFRRNLQSLIADTCTVNVICGAPNSPIFLWLLIFLRKNNANSRINWFNSFFVEFFFFLNQIVQKPSNFTKPRLLSITGRQNPRLPEVTTTNKKCRKE